MYLNYCQYPGFPSVETCLLITFDVFKSIHDTGNDAPAKSLLITFDVFK